jgi:hypothetical protein
MSNTPWTVLIFMLVDEDALVPYALIDLRDMQRIGKAHGFNLVVEVRWHNSAPERYELRDGGLQPLPPLPPRSDGERKESLQSFLLDATRDYPASHYVVMLWGHAYGFGFGRHVESRIPFPHLREVFDDFAAARAGTKLEILACNACRIGKVETVYELHGVVRYLVASQVGVPYEGWPLRAVLGDLVKNPSIEPGELASMMVTRFCDSYRQRTVAMTMLDLEASEPLLAKLDALAALMYDALGESGTEVRALHKAFVLAANEQEETEPVVDLHEFCVRLQETSQDPRIKEAATGILDTLRDPAFVAKHDGLGPGSERLHGIGLYVPHVMLDPRTPVYAKLGLEHARLWSRALDRLRSAGKHRAVLEAIDVLEAETLGVQRSAVGQADPAASGG